MGLLDGQVTIVTGSANPNGIGFATATRFVEEGAKAVVLVDIDEQVHTRKEELEGLRPGVEIRSYVANVADDKQMGVVIDATYNEFGHIDSVLSNAAVNTPGNATTVSKEDFMRTYEINVYAPFLMAKLVVPIMKKQGKGSIIDMCSANARVAEYDLAPYVGSKGAIESQTQANALDFARYGVRCNAIAPGLLHTGFNDPHHNHRGETQEELTAVIEQIHPTGKLINPIEIANIAVFLASDLSTACVGTTIFGDAGFSIK
jgi:dihydroanticapsin dehydrogenase